MYQEEENIQHEDHEVYDCTPAIVLRYMAEIIAIVVMLGGLITCHESILLGFSLILGGLYIGVTIWVLSLIVRVCYKYLNL